MGHTKHRPLSADPLPILPGWKEGDELEPSTLYGRTRPDEVAEGQGASPEHHQLSKPTALVGAEVAPYPPQPKNSPWAKDPTEDHRQVRRVPRYLELGDTPNAPSGPMEVESRRPFDYAAATDRELFHRKASAALVQKTVVEGPQVEVAQDIIDECEAEERRRLRRL